MNGREVMTVQIFSGEEVSNGIRQECLRKNKLTYRLRLRPIRAEIETLQSGDLRFAVVRSAFYPCSIWRSTHAW